MPEPINIRPRILFLPRWYPHAWDPMPGLFIRRQAESVTPWCDVAVLYVHPDEHALNDFESVFSKENGVHTLRIYYRLPGSLDSIRGKIRNHFRFFRAYWRGFRMLGDLKPDIVHVHTMTRHGVIAWIYRILTGTPYVITEHWSRYLPASGTYKGTSRKWFTRMVVKNADAVIAVSEVLKQAMQEKGLTNRIFRVVANPVDTGVFTIHDQNRVKADPVKRILHISCFDDASKNISGFLRAIKEISLVRNDFNCHLVGTGPDFNAMEKYAGDLNIPAQVVTFTGLLEGEDLVNEINNSDFLVLSSNYETFGAVVVETLACGVPVLATRVGIVPEIVNSDNGEVIDPGNEKDLVSGISRMLDECRNFDREKVRGSVSERFSTAKIGRDLMDIYTEVLNKQH